MVLDAYQAWLLFGPYAPAQVQLVLANGVGTNFNSTQRAIYIDNRSLPDSGFPDTWDKDVIYHEYGHVIEWDLDFFDAGGGPHAWNLYLSADVSTSEGFAHWISSVLRNDPFQRNYFSNFVNYSWLNLENGEYGLNSTKFGSVNNDGENFEGAVAGMFWDIYDNANDDYSTYGGGDTPDGISDTLRLGYDEIFSSCLRNTSPSHKPDDIYEFWVAWFQPPSLGHRRGMMDISYEHGQCCMGIRGDINADGVETNVLDLTYLTDRIFKGGPPPFCAREADLNENSISAEVGDLTYLVDRLFRGGPPPPSCDLSPF